MIRALIVDDEKSGRENLSHLIEEFCNGIKITATASSVNEAIEKVKLYSPDVLFLDIDMPHGTGFDLLNKLEYKPLTVFVTAHANFAIKAIKNDAFDYILKPIDIDELVECIKRLLSEINEHKKEAETRPGQKQRLKISDSKGVHLLEVSDIIYLEADNNYTIIHLEKGSHDGKFVVSRTMGEYESVLPQESFFRIHKSYIINIDKMKNYTRDDSTYVVMSNGDTIEISRRKVSKFRQYLNEQFGENKWQNKQD